MVFAGNPTFCLRRGADLAERNSPIMKNDPHLTEDGDQSRLEARRRFLPTCGRYAAVTPPVISLLLSIAGPNYAIAASGSGRAGEWQTAPNSLESMR
jgi:hypothetical protein